MTKEHLKRIHLIYELLVSAVIIVAGVCFILSCVAIYHSGDEPYSREVVAIAFSRIAFPVYLCLALVIGGFILNYFLPLSKEQHRIERSDSIALERLYRRTDLAHCDETLLCSIAKEKKRRKLHVLISGTLFLVGSTVFLIYALNFEHFHPTEINASVIDAMKLLIPCLAIPFAYLIYTAYDQKKSIHRELALVREANANGAKNKTTPDTNSRHCSGAKQELLILAVRCIFLIIGIGLTILGIATGGMADVLAKAINICTECIGLG